MIEERCPLSPNYFGPCFLYTITNSIVFTLFRSRPNDRSSFLQLASFVSLSAASMRKLLVARRLCYSLHHASDIDATLRTSASSIPFDSLQLGCKGARHHTYMKLSGGVPRLSAVCCSFDERTEQVATSE